MKALFQSAFAAILLCVWAIPPQAQALPSLGSTENALRAVFTLEKAKPFIISLVDKDGKVVSQFLSKPANDLSAFLPSKISGDFKKAAGFSFAKMAGEKLLRFPAETLGFFISLGAVVTYNLWKQSAENPVAFEQLVDSQLDPVGQMGFYAFMLANGAVAEPFMPMIEGGRLHPRLAPFITYGGMSIGMIASNIVSEIGHWPGLAQCANDVWTKATDHSDNAEKMKTCDKAAQAWTERGGFGGISNEWAPGLISLIGSTMLAGAIQGAGRMVLSLAGNAVTAVVIYAGRWTLGKTIQMAAVEIAFCLVPGGLYMKGIRVVIAVGGFIGQMTLFNAVQQWLEAKVTSAYGNFTKSRDLIGSDKELTDDLLNVKVSGWDEAHSAKLARDVLEFSKLMKAWRQMNMNEALQFQANWEQKLGQLSKGYGAAHFFYTDFMDRLWQIRFGPYKAGYASGEAISITDQIFPLNGVTVATAAGGAAVKDETTWLEAPDMIEDRQMLTIRNVMKTFKTTPLTQSDIKIFNAVAIGMQQADRKKVGQALDELNCYLHVSRNRQCEWHNTSAALYQTFTNLRKAIGEPQPIWQPGLGYIVAYNNTALYKTSMDNAVFPKSWMLLSTPTMPESMIASMFYGPDPEKGESTVKTSEGFKDLFKPPRIRREEVWKPNLHNHSEYAYEADIFNSQIYTYFTRGNVRKTVLDANQDVFKNWWKKYPETDYVHAWIDYEKLYQHNIATLIELMNRQETSSFNRGPVSNGVLTSYLQEVRFYTMVLGEIMKDSLLIKAQKVPDELFASENKIVNLNKESEDVQLLSYLKANSSMDFAAYMKFQQVPVTPAFDIAERRNLVWQNNILSQFQELSDFAKQLHVRDIRTSAGPIANMPVSTLVGKDFDAKADKFRKYLGELRTVAFADVLLLHPTQKALVEICFKAIAQNLTEMKGLIDAANVASYVERHDGQGHTSRRCQTAKPQNGLGGVQAVQRMAEGC